MRLRLRGASSAWGALTDPFAEAAVLEESNRHQMSYQACIEYRKCAIVITALVTVVQL